MISANHHDDYCFSQLLLVVKTTQYLIIGEEVITINRQNWLIGHPYSISCACLHEA